MLEGILVLILFWGGMFFIGWVINTISDLSKKHKEEIRDQVARELLNGMDIKSLIEDYKNKLAHINYKKPADSIDLQLHKMKKQLWGNDAVLMGDCPECKKGGLVFSLVVRKGKYGKFLGCTRYPKCKYTKNITEARTDYKKSINEQIAEDIQQAYSL